MFKLLIQIENIDIYDDFFFFFIVALVILLKKYYILIGERYSKKYNVHNVKTNSLWWIHEM